MSLIQYFQTLGIDFSLSSAIDKPAFGLALGGGAARGLAHIGVIRYIEKSGIQINEVSGTSMGSIIAALFANGYTSSEMEQLVEKVRLLNLVDPILKNGLIKGDKIKTYLESLFGEKRIEDSNIALKIIATDIDTGKKKVFHTGKISEAVRASISIPGIFEPCEINGKRFVDGGLTENIPVSVLKNKNIIAVSALRDISRSTKKETKLLGMTFENPFATSYVIMQKA